MVLGMDKEKNQCSELSEKTMDILDNDVLVNLFVSTQKNNLDLCIEQGIKLVFLYISNVYILKTHRSIWMNGAYLLFLKGYSNQIKYRETSEERPYCSSCDVVS